MEKDNSKIITISFVIAGAIIWGTMTVLLNSLSGSFAFVARMRALDLVNHGLPISLGILTFALLQFNPKVVAWADEVVVEIRKVVWPSRKDTMGMTTVVCIMVVIAGVAFGIWDFISGHLIKMLLN